MAIQVTRGRRAAAPPWPVPRDGQGVRAGWRSPARVACIITVPAGGVAGQQPEPPPRVELRGRGDADNDAFIRRTLRDPRLIVIARDTVIGHADTIPGTALVVGATARIDGVVAGDLVAVDANVFLRPTAHVQGSVRNIAGGFYPSDLATIDGTTTSDPTAAYFVRPRDDGLFIIQGITRQRIVVFSGFYGLQPPAYDRVDGVTVTSGRDCSFHGSSGSSPCCAVMWTTAPSGGSSPGVASSSCPGGAPSSWWVPSGRRSRTSSGSAGT
jgi:hypothetical protein